MNAFTARIAPITFKGSEQARVLRAINQQPPRHEPHPSAVLGAGAAAVLAIRNSQFDAQRRARRVGA